MDRKHPKIYGFQWIFTVNNQFASRVNYWKAMQDRTPGKIAPRLKKKAIPKGSPKKSSAYKSGKGTPKKKKPKQKQPKRKKSVSKKPPKKA